MLKFRINIAISLRIMFPLFLNRICKVCAVVTATLLLPLLAFAGTDNGNGNDGQNNGNQYGRNPPMTTVPEANAGWVLIPFFGVVLLVAARQFLLKKA